MHSSYAELPQSKSVKIGKSAEDIQASLEQANLALVGRLFDEVYSKYNIDVLDELFAHDIKLHDPASKRHKEGLKTLKELERTYAEAFPNKKVRIDSAYATENTVIVRWSCAGIHVGPLTGLKPTNKPFMITGIGIYRIAEGKIAEIWQNWDRLGLLEQLGEVTPAAVLHY